MKKVSKNKKDDPIKTNRKKAAEDMDKLANSGTKFSTKEFLKTRHDGLL